ncbi:hypothetical protein [Priestia megaterium]|uniref:hypothetical protein n=1 Tax=Priestia megaterium TaxID=1404 RepID=UPI0034D53F6A
MDNNLNQDSSIFPADRAQKDNYSLTSLFKDVSVFVLVLTGFSYLVAFVFKQGFLSYYKISDLLLDKIGFYYFANSFSYMLLSLAGCCTIYLMIKFMFFSIRKEKVHRPLLILLSISLIVLFLLESNFNINIKESFVYSVLGFISIIIIIDWILDEKYTTYKEKFNPKKEHVASLLLAINKNRTLKFIFIILSLVVLLYSIQAKGKITAQQKVDYSIIKKEVKIKKEAKIKKKTIYYVVIDQTGSNLLVAPLDIKKEVIIPKYRFIDLKSTLNKPIILEPRKFKSGLKVR